MCHRDRELSSGRAPPAGGSWQGPPRWGAMSAAKVTVLLPDSDRAALSPRPAAPAPGRKPSQARQHMVTVVLLAAQARLARGAAEALLLQLRHPGRRNALGQERETDLGQVTGAYHDRSDRHVEAADAIQLVGRGW